MGEKPRVTLPAVEQALAEARGLVAGSPTVDVARERLGGRASTEAAVGQAVRVTSSLGVEHLGVVVFRREGQVDVWLGAGRVRRLSASEPTPASDHELPKALAAVAARAIIFASLWEGQRVRFETKERASSVGLLVEKCRYGALVLRDLEGAETRERIMAVGFSSIEPA